MQREYFVHDFDPVLIHIYGDIGIRYYGLAYVLGFVIAFFMMRSLYKHGKFALTPDQQLSAMFTIVVGVLIGGRLGFAFLYNLETTLSNPLTIFYLWRGGMASHGGFIGVVIASWLVARRYAIPLSNLTDVMAYVTPQGLLLGRIANFINGELWGTKTTVPWAVIFPQSAPPGTPLSAIPPRHPSQLYEAGLEGLLPAIYMYWRVWHSKALKTPGQLTGEFLIIYSVGRTIAEQFRVPDASLIFGLNRGIFYTIFLFLAGIIVIYLSRRRHRARV